MPFPCNICNVSLNSQDQLAQHQSGSKHLKKLKAAGLAATAVLNAGPGISSSNTTKGKRTYGNFVASDTLMPISTQLITPPKNLNASATTATNVEVAPPPPPPPPAEQAITPLNSATSAYKESPPPPPPPPPPQPPVKQQQRVPGVNPVVQAVVDNALGKLPLKRKAYDGKCEICKVVYTSESHERQHLMGSKHTKKAKIAAAAQGNIPLAAFTGFNCTYCNVVLNSLDQLTAHREGQKHKQTVLKLQKQGKVKEECKDVTVVQV